MSIRGAVVAFLACASPLAAQSRAASARRIDWHRDLAVLRRELPKRHPAPFLHITPAAWDSAVTALDRHVQSLDRDQVVVGIFQLVALLGDAHTTVEPDSALALHYYPLELYDFEDGLYVRRADSAHAALVGARVLRLGNQSAADAMTRIAAVIPHENAWWVRAWGPFWLMIPEVAHGLGMVPDPEHLHLVVQQAGHLDSVDVRPAGLLRAPQGSGPIAMQTWLTMRQAPAPLWEQRPEATFWWTVDSAHHTLYAAMRAVGPGPRSTTNRAQWDSLFRLSDSLGAARLVIDVRENLGGNGGLNRYPVQQILRRPSIDRRDRLFVVIGRRTFSAGQQFTNLLEAWTQATLVGEPSGQRPSQYGDHRPLELPSSHLVIQISSIFHQAPNEFDNRAFVPPTIYTPLTSTEYRTGVDPAWEAIIAFDTSGAVLQTVMQRLVAGDSAGAEQALQAARDAVANRFRPLERDVNALGYRWLAGDSLRPALLAFWVNTRAYPGSANTFDSYGEALLAAGQREAAIAAYRHALAVDSTFPPSLAALERLGVARDAPPATPGATRTYATHVTLVRSSCGPVTIHDGPTTVTYDASTGAVTLTHAGATYTGVAHPDGAFATRPTTVDAGDGFSYSIVVAGRLHTDALVADVTVDRSGAGGTCQYLVHWVGTS